MRNRWLIKLVSCFVIVLSVPGWSALAAPVRQAGVIELVYGQTVDGQLDSTQPSVFYAFNASNGDVVTVAMIATGGTIDPFLVLNDAAQSPLATDDNSGGEGNARLTFVIPADGRYIIQATNSGGIPPSDGGTFSLNLTAAVNGEAVVEPTPEPIATEIPAPVPTEMAPPEPTPDTGTQPASDPVAQGDSIRLVALESGTTVRDTLDRQTAVRYYWFEAGTGDQITVTPEQASAFKPLVVLYNGNFEEQQRVAPGIGMQAALRSSGVFFLAVSLPDAGNVGGEYGFIFGLTENLASSANFEPVTYGQSVQGTIDATTPSKTYSLQGIGGDTVTVVMNRASGDLDSYLYLLDENGQLLFEDNDSGGENGNARLVYTLPVDGTYLITATRMGQAQGTTSGGYLLDVISNAAPPVASGEIPPTAEPTPSLPPDYAAFPQIAYGETVEGELSDAKFMDIYVFYGEEGDTITAEMVSQNKEEFNGLDPLLVLLDDARIPLAEHDDLVDGVERDSQLEYTLDRTGYFAIVATRFEQDSGDSAGPYALELTGSADGEEPGNTDTEVLNLPDVSDESLVGELDTVRLVPGTPAQATFNGGADLYVFPASAGSRVDISVTADAGLDTIVILADKNLNEIISSGSGALRGITLTNTGQYAVLVAPRFGPVDASGGYIVALTQTQGESTQSETAEAGSDSESDSETGTETEIIEGTSAIVYGDTVSGTITDQQISRLYSFTGAEGDRVQITLEAAPGSELDTYLELQDANGDVIDANDDINPGVIRDSQIVTVLPTDGSYTLVVSRYVGPDAPLTEGAYELSLQLEAEDAVEGVSTGTVPISYDQTLVGEISDDQYLVFYVFNGTAGDTITIEVDVLTGTLDPVLHLYQSVGDQWFEIANNDDAPTGGTYAPLLSGIILPQTGKYLIAVNRYGLERENTVGTFAITLTRDS